MAAKVLKYRGKDIVVTYDVSRCIHAAECIKGLPSVFDPHRKPWVNPDDGPASEVADVIHRCPSGALQYERLDEGSPEPVPSENTVDVQANGPLYLRGDIEIRQHDGTVSTTTTRVALCRCGASSNKPFCDNSHKNISFVETGVLGEGGAKKPDAEEQGGGRLIVTISPNGSLRLSGPITLVGADGETRETSRVSLCRCGASSNKPFCDTTHRDIGFSG